GAKRAVSRIAWSVAAATGSGANRRTAPVERSASTMSVIATSSATRQPVSRLSGGDLAAHDVERRPGFEPLDLLGAERVRALEVDRRAVGLDDLTAHVPPGHRRQIEHVDAVVLLDLVVRR